MNTIVRFFHSERGMAATEYAIMFALIIVACIATIALLGNSMGNLFASLADTFSDSA